MKIKSLLTSVIALALVAAACDKPKEEVAAIISATPVSINNVAAAGGTYNVDVVTTTSWTATCDSWISVDPASGTGSAQSSKMTVTVTVAENTSEQPREGVIKFSISGSSASVPVKQLGKTETPVNPDNPVNPDEPVVFSGIIDSPAQMKAFLAAAAEIAEGVEVPVEADIDMKDVEFTSPFEFHGILNGKNHTIKNIKSSTSLLLQNYGTVKDLVLEGEFSVDANGPTFVAALTNINYGTVQNVTNKASVTIHGADPAGVGIAGIACESYGPIVNCKNEGAITLDAAGYPVSGAPVGGIVGILGSTVSGCVNSGAVSLTADYLAGKSILGQIGMLYNKTPQVAGIAAYAVKDAEHQVSVSGCNNSGKITLRFTQCDKMPVTMEEKPGRLGVAGIVAATGGDITDCNNTGEIYLYSKSSDGQTVAVEQTSLLLHASGIAAHEYFPATPKQNVTNVRNCNNYGNLYIDSDSSYGYSTAAGIYAWPGVEGTQNKVVENCVNSGNITVNGACKIRVGGVAGGTGHIISCKNTGNINVESSLESSVCGLLIGFSTQSHRFENCETSGTITSKVKVTALSGLIGGMGNYAVQTGGGCKVNAVINGTADTPNAGLVVGYFNGNTKNIVLGNYSSPVAVKGKVNGTTVTADNFESYLTSPEGSDGNKYKPGVHSIIAEYGEGGGNTNPGGGEGDVEYTYPQLASFNGRALAELAPGTDYAMAWPDAWLKSDNGSSKLSIHRPEYNGAARNAPGKLSYELGSSYTWTNIPYVVCQGFILGDYWLFEVPVKNLPAGTVTFKGAGGCSTASVKFWLMEFSVDGQNTWTAVAPKTTTSTASGTDIGREVTYTIEYPKAGKNELNNVYTPIEYSFANPAVSGEGVLYIRIKACDLLKGDESGDVTNPENGGGSRLGDVITITHSK